MNKPLVLLVDDDTDILEFLTFALERDGFEVKSSTDGETAFNIAKQTIPDIIVLDMMMPGWDGLETCRHIRKEESLKNSMIVFLTARSEDYMQVEGLDTGADDYVTKPFQPLELIARVKAQLRRSQKYNNSNQKENVIDFRGILINKDTHEFYFNEKKVELTKIEFEILWLLCENRGKVIKTDELFSKVWGSKYFEKDNNTVMVHIRHLREKMNDIGKKPKYIKTVYGVGYKIEK